MGCVNIYHKYRAIKDARDGYYYANGSKASCAVDLNEL
jgi:hypothetical protein